jgi:hypothetical protein
MHTALGSHYGMAPVEHHGLLLTIFCSSVDVGLSSSVADTGISTGIEASDNEDNGSAESSESSDEGDLFSNGSSSEDEAQGLEYGIGLLGLSDPLQTSTFGRPTRSSTRKRQNLHTEMLCGECELPVEDPELLLQCPACFDSVRSSA